MFPGKGILIIKNDEIGTAQLKDIKDGLKKALMLDDTDKTKLCILSVPEDTDVLKDPEATGLIQHWQDSINPKSTIQCKSDDELEQIFILSDSLEAVSVKSELDRLKKDIEDAKAEATKNWDALKLLMSICKSRNFDPFHGESAPFTVHPSLMSKEELVARNKEATSRITATHHVTSEEALDPPGPEEMTAMYTNTGFMSEMAILASKSNKGLISIDDFKNLCSKYMDKMVKANEG